MKTIVPEKVLSSFDEFVDNCWKKSGSVSLVPYGEDSSFALCFGIFSLHLTQRSKFLNREKDNLKNKIIENLNFAIPRKDGTDAYEEGRITTTSRVPC